MAHTPPASTAAKTRAKALAFVAGLVALWPSAAWSASYIAITPDQPLRFGSIVVAQSGTRIVSSTGNITNTNLVPVSGSAAGPAQFTITYHRDPASSLPLLLVTQITLASVPSFTQGNISGTVSSFDTDLPGNPTLTPGQGQTITWQLCFATDCVMTFHVGGRLDISSAVGGGPVVVALPVTANVIAAI